MVYGGLNFGLIRIDWDAQPLMMHADVIDVNGTVRFQQTIQSIPIPRHTAPLSSSSSFSTPLFFEENEMLCVGEEMHTPLISRVDVGRVVSVILFVFLGSLFLRLYFWVRAWLSRRQPQEKEN